MAAEGQQSQLYKELAEDLLIAENKLLSSIHFPFVRPKDQVVDQEKENKFNAQNWYTDNPCEEDTLYQIVQNVFKVVQGSLRDIEELLEKRLHCGESSQYLILIPDEDRQKLTIDQVLALYLIDISELCKQTETEPPAKPNSKKDKDQNALSQNHRNNYHFYQMACCFVQQYRNCLIETLNKKFGINQKTKQKHAAV